jgi:hypothetical protein
MTGQTIFDWISARLDEGLTVYATTYLRSIKITKRNLDRGQVRVAGQHCEVQMGKRWDSINGCKITAR